MEREGIINLANAVKGWGKHFDRLADKAFKEGNISKCIDYRELANRYIFLEHSDEWLRAEQFRRTGHILDDRKNGQGNCTHYDKY